MAVTTRAAVEPGSPAPQSPATGTDPSPGRTTAARSSATAAMLSARQTLARLWSLPQRPLSVVTGFGWSVAILAVVAWVIGWQTGWYEFMIVALMAIALLVLALPFLIGRAFVTVDIELSPDRVTVGSRAAGRIVATNSARGRLLPMRLELPVGAGVASFDLPSLASGASHEELFVVPTVRRAVIPVGPTSSVRGDPLGLLRRVITAGERKELIVHPAVVRLESLGSGFLRDLEGQTTNHLSSSDVAFHTLRDYVPGDDRRFVHWRTSARTGRLMVRQFVDTRRSHAAVVLDLDPASYAEPTSAGDPAGDEFELTVAAAASFGLRVLRDEQTLTVLTAQGRQPSRTGRALLDGMARLEQAPGMNLAQAALLRDRFAADASIVVLFTGSRASLGDLRRGVHGLSPDVRVVSVRSRLGGGSAFREVAGLTVLELGDVHELARLLQTVVR